MQLAITYTDELEQQFIKHTAYLFDWTECECLIKTEAEPTIYAENITLEEAIELIEQGYTAIPF